MDQFLGRWKKTTTNGLFSKQGKSNVHKYDYSNPQDEIALTNSCTNFRRNMEIQDMGLVDKTPASFPQTLLKMSFCIPFPQEPPESILGMVFKM